MNRTLELRKRFYEEPCVDASMKLEVIHPGFAEVAMIVSNYMTIKEGFANGGFLTMLGNTAGVYAAMSKIPSGHTKLINITTYPVSPAMKEECIAGSARVMHESNQYIWVTFEVRNSRTGQLKAFGSAQYIKPKNDTLS